jgi:hypothetical protein
MRLIIGKGVINNSLVRDFIEGMGLVESPMGSIPQEEREEILAAILNFDSHEHLIRHKKLLIDNQLLSG